MRVPFHFPFLSVCFFMRSLQQSVCEATEGECVSVAGQLVSWLWLRGCALAWTLLLPCLRGEAVHRVCMLQFRSCVLQGSSLGGRPNSSAGWGDSGKRQDLGLHLGFLCQEPAVSVASSFSFPPPFSRHQTPFLPRGFCAPCMVVVMTLSVVWYRQISPVHPCYRGQIWAFLSLYETSYAIFIAFFWACCHFSPSMLQLKLSARAYIVYCNAFISQQSVQAKLKGYLSIQTIITHKMVKIMT